jgi:hypothetical protein
MRARTMTARRGRAGRAGGKKLFIIHVCVLSDDPLKAEVSLGAVAASDTSGCVCE